MRKLLLWLVMVAVMIAAILGGTAAFLYSRTGTDALPQEAVTFGEQTLEPNGWSWVIPVLGDKVNKTYESPTNLTVQKLGTFTDTIPQLTLPAWVTSATVQITAPDGTTWSGDKSSCNTYTYAQNGDYQIIVTAYHNDADAPGDPAGWYAYRAGFTMAMNPKVTLSTERAAQGSIVAIQLSGILDGEPSVESDLGTVWFRKTSSGYMGYLPVTYNAEMGEHTLTLTSGSHALTAQVEVRAADFAKTPEVEAQSWSSAAAQEYRTVIWPLYQQGDRAPQWLGRFTQPVQGSTVQAYGAYLADGARSTELRIQAADGDEVVAPTDGVVVYAGTLQLGGNTVVIDHGCGLKSYLCGLRELSVSEGAQLTQGELVGLAGQEPVTVEMRIGNMSINPVNTFKGQGGLFMK